MQLSDQSHTILSNLREPAFTVADGIITAVNTAAAQHFAEVGMNIADFIITGKEEYDAFQDGSLYMTICLSGTTYPCSVTKLENAHLFILEQDTAQSELQALALAAQQLTTPFAEISLLVDRIAQTDSEQLSKIHQDLFRIRRILNNMADSAHLTVSKPRMTSCEICSVFGEILEKANTVLSPYNVSIAYTLPNHRIFTLASSELLRRAVYNLISNAVKFSKPGSSIEAALNHNGQRVSFSITSICDDIPRFAQGNMFNRYTRQPGLEDPRHGLGLGMKLTHSVAAAHGGTVLVEKLQDQKIRITLSLSIRQDCSGNLCSPILIPDIYSGSDQALIELSDVLDYRSY